MPDLKSYVGKSIEKSSEKFIENLNMKTQNIFIERTWKPSLKDFSKNAWRNYFLLKDTGRYFGMFH